MFTEKVNKHLLHTNAMTTINQIRITWKIIIFFKEKKKAAAFHLWIKSLVQRKIEGGKKEEGGGERKYTRPNRTVTEDAPARKETEK